MSHSCLNCGKKYDTEEKLKRHEKNCDRDIPSTPSRSVSRSGEKSEQLIKLIESERSRTVANPLEPRVKTVERDIASLKNDIKKHSDKFELLARVIDEKLTSPVNPPVSPCISEFEKEYNDVECKMLKRTIESQKTSYLKNLNSMQKEVDQYKKQMDDMEVYNTRLHNDFELLVDSYNKKIVEIEKDIQLHYIEEYKKNIKEYKDKSDLYELLKQKLEDMEVDKKAVIDKERVASRLKDECLAKLNEMNKKTADIVRERNELFQKCSAFEIRIKDLDSREQLLTSSNKTIESMRVELENKQQIINDLLAQKKI
jgi:hypothetical protein